MEDLGQDRGQHFVHSGCRARRPWLRRSRGWLPSIMGDLGSSGYTPLGDRSFNPNFTPYSMVFITPPTPAQLSRFSASPSLKWKMILPNFVQHAMQIVKDNEILSRNVFYAWKKKSQGVSPATNKSFSPGEAAGSTEPPRDGGAPPPPPTSLRCLPRSAASWAWHL